jgi:hypothetical protein
MEDSAVEGPNVDHNDAHDSNVNSTFVSFCSSVSSNLCGCFQSISW